MSHTSNLCLVLHAHLPFVRHPEAEEYLEEDWLFEAVHECYVPLAIALWQLKEKRTPYRLAISFSPPLIAMLDDGLLRKRSRNHVDKLLRLAQQQCVKHPADTLLGKSARQQQKRSAEVLAFLDHWQDDVLAAFRILQNDGLIEVLTCNATHGLMPLMSTPQAVRAQIRSAVSVYTRSFGRRPRGMWLAECGLNEQVDRMLAAEGIDYTCVESVAVEKAHPRPEHGVYAPVCTPAGTTLLARDRQSAEQVWSAQVGYPADGAYREFHRDLGFDGDYDEVRPYLHQDGVRRAIGFKNHRVTSASCALHDKELYDPHAAELKAKEHAQHFVAARAEQGRVLAANMHAAGSDLKPSMVACYDAELFGHWWHEGPIFLQEVLRLAAGREEINLCTPEDLADDVDGIVGQARESRQEVVPCASTWGVDGDNRVWLIPDNAWLYRYQHWAEEMMSNLAHRARGQGDLLERAAKQAARELMLMQSSDWAFLIAAGTNPSYATRRFKEHFESFRRLCDQVLGGAPLEKDVSMREARTPLLAHIDLDAWL